MKRGKDKALSTVHKVTSEVWESSAVQTGLWRCSVICGTKLDPFHQTRSRCTPFIDIRGQQVVNEERNRRIQNALVAAKRYSGVIYKSTTAFSHLTPASSTRTENFVFSVRRFATTRPAVPPEPRINHNRDIWG